MPYEDLREFIDALEKKGLLKRVKAGVDPSLEASEIMDRTIRKGGPALLFENVLGSRVPILGNLFGTRERVALGLGVKEDELQRLGAAGNPHRVYTGGVD